MRHLTRSLRALVVAPRRAWRYGIVAALAFMLGSATIVTAAITGTSFGSIFFVTMFNGAPTTPCTTFTDALGKATTTCVAVVNAKGELATSDADTTAALNRLQFGGDGSLKVSAQGTSTISGNVAVTGGHLNVDNLPATQNVAGAVGVNNFPATQQVAGTVNVGNLPATQQVSGSVSVSNLPATQPVSGTVNVGNFPPDQLIHGAVTISNLPAAGGGGVRQIALPTQHTTGSFVRWAGVDVSGCRQFSVVVTAGTYRPSIDVATRIGAHYFLPVLKTFDFANTEYAFPYQPSSTEPFFSPSIEIDASGPGNHDDDVSGLVFCQN